jgi:hypothetical protein
MLVRALAVATLLTATSLEASETPPEEEKAEPTRSVRPTEQELATFQLAQPELAPIPDAPPFFAASGFGMFAASAADFATTEVGLSSGLNEGNPVAQDRGLRLVHHVVGPAAVWWTTEKLRQNGKTKLALSLRIAVMVAYSYAAIHNTYLVSSASPTP